MGKTGMEIVGKDREAIIVRLNTALADEWLAYYQYWIGAKVVRGPMKDAVAQELIQHAADELRHAGLLADRILQLGGTPLLSPEEWVGVSGCGYEAPSDSRVEVILAQNLVGEECAIRTYHDFLRLVREPDPVTYEIILGILKDEVTHEEDLQNLLEDLEQLRRDRPAVVAPEG